MTVDPSIREQTYQYFLQEAPELLQALEQGLLSFKEDHGIHQVNNLMRATHTLKGAATSVGLETIATVAHSLEDIFKALCNPEAVIDSEVEALLFEGVECLRLPLAAEFTGGAINHAEILDRAATIFAQLQEKLGDCFGQTVPLPSSADLGFDVVQSIFEVGVAQRLDQLAATLADASAEEIVAVLQTQAEVFLGLAESLNLQGFGAIAQATLVALDQHPDQAIAIAETALADFQAGQVAVLSGDRTQGGFPSQTLQQLSGLQTPASELGTDSEADSNQPESDASPAESTSLLENIWGGQAVLIDSSLVDADEDLSDQSAAIAVVEATPSLRSTPLPPPQPAVSPFTASLQKDWATQSPQVRVNVKHLEELNYSIGELLTNYSRQRLQAEQIQSSVQTLRSRLKQHEKLLTQLRDSTHQPRKSRKSKRNVVAKIASSRDEAPLLQSLLDDMVQLAEVADAIDLFTLQSIQTLENQQHLLTNTRSALIEARMLPLGEILNRLPSVLQQLETLHNKPVILELRGAEVLVDKVVAEKLYDPLLHLVRNAFDHGIESTSVRQQQGKTEQGKIEICAHNQGRYLLIEVSDDGKGIDFEQILERAIDRQLVSPEQALKLTQAQLIDLLFEPGFSTAFQVNDLSGRGVGLDVVRNQVHALRGAVSVRSQPGQGTTFVLQIPLNLTIAPLLVCEADAKLYALLDDAIEQIVIPQSSQIQERNQRKVLRWGKGNQAQLVPIYPFSEVVDYTTVPASIPLQTQALGSETAIRPETAIKPVILLRSQDMLLGLEVDQMVGEQELVIRPLGTLIGAPPYVHGACILADRRLALVIDGARLIQKAIAPPQTPEPDSNCEKTQAWLLPSYPEPQLLPQVSLPALPSQAINTAPIPQILVVEDSITTRHGIALTLQKAGYQVFQAQNGHEALTQLQHHSEIQLVLSDLEMPGMNGFEFLRQAQQTPSLAHLPILILTSRSDESYRSLALQLGAAAYMTKPYMEHKLLAMVAQLVEKTMLSAVPS